MSLPLSSAATLVAGRNVAKNSSAFLELAVAGMDIFVVDCVWLKTGGKTVTLIKNVPQKIQKIR